MPNGRQRNGLAPPPRGGDGAKGTVLAFVLAGRFAVFSVLGQFFGAFLGARKTGLARRSKFSLASGPSLSIVLSFLFSLCCNNSQRLYKRLHLNMRITTVSSLAPELLKTIAAWAEVAAVLLTALGALSGVTYVLVTRPLRTIEQREKAILVGQVAAAQSVAATANQKAEEATERAVKIEGDNIKLKGALEREAAESSHKAEELRKQNLATEGRLTEAKADVEKVNAARLELESSLTPRRLTLTFGPNGSNVDPMTAFAGKLGIFIEYVPDDAEAKRAAGEIRGLLNQARWEVLGFGPSEKVIHEGVEVAQYHPMEPSTNEAFQETGEDGKILDTLVDFLHSCGWVADRTYAAAAFPGETVPPHTARVRVGIKPIPYFDPQWVKDEEKKMQQMKERLKRFEQQFPQTPR
jgi:hypothetical protein